MNENKLYCPLLLACDSITNLDGWVCRKENCAWWVEDKQKCAVALTGGKK